MDVSCLAVMDFAALLTRKDVVLKSMVGVLLCCSVASGLDFSPIGAAITAEQVAEARNPKSLRQIADEDAKAFAVDGKLSHEVYYIIADKTVARCLAMVLNSTSVQPVLEKCVPINVNPEDPIDLWRINIGDLQWRYEDWRAALATHPYGGFSLVVRGDWLLEEITDSQLSRSKRDLSEAEAIEFLIQTKGLTISVDEIRTKYKHELTGLTDGVWTYDRLLYGADLPKTFADFKAFWGVNDDPERQQVIIDGESPVNVQGLRWAQLSPTDHYGVQYMTRDSKRLTSKTSALENPEGGIASPIDFQDDGREWIWTFQKRSIVTNKRVNVQFYALSQKDGSTTTDAPVDLVQDYKRFRGLSNIRVPGSCMHCHPGIWKLSPSAFVEMSVKYKVSPERDTPEELDKLFALHYGELTDQTEADSAEYEEALMLLTEWDSTAFAEALQGVVLKYDSPLSLQDAAIELGTTADLLQKLLIDYGDPGSPGGAIPSIQGLLRMVRGGKIRRDSFEESFPLLQLLLTR